jgi:hypothetical protein
MSVYSPKLTIKILDITRRPVYYLKHTVWGPAFCLCLREVPAQFGPSPGTENSSIYIGLNRIVST